MEGSKRRTSGAKQTENWAIAGSGIAGSVGKCFFQLSQANRETYPEEIWAESAAPSKPQLRKHILRLVV